MVTLLETVLGDFSRLEAETKAQELAADKEKGGIFFGEFEAKTMEKTMEKYGKQWKTRGF